MPCPTRARTTLNPFPFTSCSIAAEMSESRPPSRARLIPLVSARSVISSSRAASAEIVPTG